MSSDGSDFGLTSCVNFHGFTLHKANVMARAKHHTGLAGTFAVAAELSRRGFDVALTIGNTPTIDLLCASPTGHPFKIQVKSASTPNFVPIGKAWLEAPPDDNLYLIVVLVSARGQSGFRFFILSHPEAVSLWANVPKTKPNGEPYASGWEGFSWTMIQSREDAWTTLPA
ncbi:MAG: hypothetical protein KY476_01545 [Planctomycetes bacterium]|nr:hypothetical protein [Planctomycetota bacterium]